MLVMMLSPATEYRRNRTVTCLWLMLPIPSITRMNFHCMSARRAVIFETYECEIGEAWGSMARLIGLFDTYYVSHVHVVIFMSNFHCVKISSFRCMPTYV